MHGQHCSPPSPVWEATWHATCTAGFDCLSDNLLQHDLHDCAMCMVSIACNLASCWTAGFECLTEDLEEIMGLFSEVIQDPALQPDKTAFYKAQVTSVPMSSCCCCCSFYVAVAVLLSASNQLSALLALLFMMCWRNVKVLSPMKHKVANWNVSSRRYWGSDLSAPFCSAVRIHSPNSVMKPVNVVEMQVLLMVLYWSTTALIEAPS